MIAQSKREEVKQKEKPSLVEREAHEGERVGLTNRAL